MTILYRMAHRYRPPRHGAMGGKVPPTTYRQEHDAMGDWITEALDAADEYVDGMRWHNDDDNDND